MVWMAPKLMGSLGPTVTHPNLSALHGSAPPAPPLLGEACVPDFDVQAAATMVTAASSATPAKYLLFLIAPPSRDPPCYLSREPRSKPKRGPVACRSGPPRPNGR